MPRKRAFSDSDEPILERVKHIIPPAGRIARSLQVEHETAIRIHKLLVLTHARMLNAEELTDQVVADSADIIDAQADQISNQRANMEQMEQFTDVQSGAQTVAQNLDVWFADDAPSIGHVLNIVNLVKVTEAGKKHMKLVRVYELIDALLSVTEGFVIK